MIKRRFNKIYIEITNICNLNCSFCPDTNRIKSFMSVENFKHIVYEIKDYTNLIALHVKGEPLMHPQLKQILKICKDIGLEVNITTNAILLDKKLDTLINSSAVRQINMSLHSISKNKDYNLEEYINNILKASVEITNKTNIIISYRLWNLENIKLNDENVKILECLGNHFHIDNLIELAKENKFVKLAEKVFLNQDIEFKWPDINREIISEKGKCWGLRNQIAILVNGDVVPCCLDQNGDINLGNIFNQKFDYIINSDFSKSIVKGFESNKVLHNLCKRCGYRTKFS